MYRRKYSNFFLAFPLFRRALSKSWWQWHTNWCFCWYQYCFNHYMCKWKKQHFCIKCWSLSKLSLLMKTKSKQLSPFSSKRCSFPFSLDKSNHCWIKPKELRISWNVCFSSFLFIQGCRSNCVHAASPTLLQGLLDLNAHNKQKHKMSKHRMNEIICITLLSYLQHLSYSW